MTTDAMPDEPGRGPDDPDFVDPLTPDDILAKATKPEGSDSQASRLVTLANSHYRLLRGDDGRPYATERQGPAIAYGLRGRDALRKRLAGLYFDTYGSTPGGSALTDALCVLEGMADRTDPEPVGLRVAAAGEGTVALDLGGEDGRCVVLDAGGWQFRDRSPVLFRRSALTAPLPEPAPCEPRRLAPAAQRRRRTLPARRRLAGGRPRARHPPSDPGPNRRARHRQVHRGPAGGFPRRPFAGAAAHRPERHALMGRRGLSIVDRGPRQRLVDPTLVLRHPVQSRHR
jgi:hypothetical protein